MTNSKQIPNVASQLEAVIMDYDIDEVLAAAYNVLRHEIDEVRRDLAAYSGDEREALVMILSEREAVAQGVRQLLCRMRPDIAELINRKECEAIMHE